MTIPSWDERWNSQQESRDYIDQKLTTKQQLITFHHILCRSKVKDVLQNVLKELKAALLCLLVVQLGLLPFRLFIVVEFLSVILFLPLHSSPGEWLSALALKGGSSVGLLLRGHEIHSSMRLTISVTYSTWALRKWMSCSGSWKGDWSWSNMGGLLCCPLHSVDYC